jgi:hypothetical protein
MSKGENNISSSNNNHSNGSTQPSVNTLSKQYLRMSKKIQEVKEVVQNRSDIDIFKVLEVCDGNVGRTIDAFVNGMIARILFIV